MLDARRVVLLCCWALVACGDDDDALDASAEDAEGAASDTEQHDPDASGMVSDGTASDGATSDAEIEDPFADEVSTNVSFETARTIEVDGEGTLQALHNAEQVDYFVLELDQGSTYVISTNTGRFSPDNVIALYDENEELIAENDIGWLWPGDEVDARLVVRATATGTHYLKIEDVATPEGYFAQAGAPVLFYRVDAHEIDASAAGVAWESSDPEVPAEIVFTDDPAAGVAYVTIIGELSEGETDTFTLLGRDAAALIGHVLPAGVHGNGSTASGGLVRIVTEDDHLLAAIDRAQGTEQIHPPVTTAPHVLSVSAEGELGDNSFYAIDLVLLPDNPLELADADNGTLDTAEMLGVQGMFYRRGTVLADVPFEDVDYLSFEATMGERMSVVCEGASAGSGIVDLKAELRDPSDAVLASATETIEDGLLVEYVTAEETGTHYLRLSSDTPEDAELAPAWTRCAVTIEQ